VRLFIVIVLLSAFVGVAALPGQSRTTWSFHSELDMFLALKVGAEYQFSDSFGMRGTLGVCVIEPAQISYTLVGISHFRKQENKCQLDLQYGLVQALFTIEPENNPYTYWVPDACISLGYRFASGHQVGIRAGVGVLFGYDLGAWQGPAFQPNLAAEYSWRKP
jgi:hypothetical protein